MGGGSEVMHSFCIYSDSNFAQTNHIVYMARAWRTGGISSFANLQDYEHNRAKLLESQRESFLSNWKVICK